MAEKSPTSIGEISHADWAKTPESVQQLVKSLIGRIEHLEWQYEELKGENQLLKEQVKQTSKNSSERAGETNQQEFINATVTRHQ